jgi:cystathionine beta-lyase/cystathionine gamma-synthase
LSEAEHIACGVAQNLVRLSVGFEHIYVIKADLEPAFKKTAPSSSPDRGEPVAQPSLN